MPFPPKQADTSNDKNTPKGPQKSGSVTESSPHKPSPNGNEQVPGANQPEPLKDDTAAQSLGELLNIAAQALVSAVQMIDANPELVTPEDAIGLQNSMVSISDLSTRAGTVETAPAEGALPEADGETPEPGASKESTSPK